MKISIIGVLSILSISLNAQLINLNIKAIRSTKGEMCVAIFSDENGFKSEEPIWESKYSKSNIQIDILKIQIPFKTGHFAISVLDDENCSGKMEYSIFGIPLEGFGFSNYYHKSLRKPKFNDFDFYIETNETKSIIVMMKYY